MKLKNIYYKVNMIFNDKYNEIINIATEQDERLRRALSVALSNVNDELRYECRNNIDFDKPYIKYKNKYETGINTRVRYSNLIIISGRIEYHISVRNFNTDWLMSLPIEESLYLINKRNNENNDANIFHFEVMNFLDDERQQLDKIMRHTLSISNLQDLGFVFRYERAADTLLSGESIEIKAVTLIPEDRIFDIANMDSNSILCE